MERRLFHFNEASLMESHSAAAVSFRVQVRYDLSEKLVHYRMKKELRQERVYFMMKRLYPDIWEFTLPLREGFEAEMEKVERAMQQIEDEVEAALQIQESLKMLEGADG